MEKRRSKISIVKAPKSRDKSGLKNNLHSQLWPGLADRKDLWHGRKQLLRKMSEEHIIDPKTLKISSVPEKRNPKEHPDTFL